MKNLLIRNLIFSLIIFSLPISLQGNIKLPVLISDGMILQRDSKIKIRGLGSQGDIAGAN